MDFDPYDLMAQALEEARRGFSEGEVPVGAVLTSAEGGIISRAHNQPIGRRDPTAHAEILAIREAAAVYQNYRLKDTTLIVTVEPCIMCMGAALHARVARLVYGTMDPKAGAAGSLYNLAAHGASV
jgi:tRNA(adenine34) deaminase